MNPLALTRTATDLEQVYLFERDAGLLCRILGLYAARGIDLLHADYSYAAEDCCRIEALTSSLLVEEECQT